MGPICFVSDDESDKLCFNWDETGRVSVVDDAEWPTFTATESNWRAFIDGQFKASAGLLRGDLRFDGRLVSIIRYSLAFNALAEVARGLDVD
jgi:putative sterol carrier protein